MTYHRKTEAPLGDRRYAVNRPREVDIKVNSAAPITSAELLAEIEPYLARSGFNRAEFGRMVFGYPGALSDLTRPKRKHPLPETIEKARRFMADNPDLKSTANRQSAVTGIELADEIDAFIAEHGLSRQRVSHHVLGYGSAIAGLRKRSLPRPETVKAVRDFLADPGPLHDLVPMPFSARVRRAAPCSFANDSVRFQRGAQLALRTNRLAAEAFLDSGKSAEDAKSVSLRIEARKVEERRRQEALRVNPIEHAKTLLRRRYPMVVNAEVVGGPKGKFVVGNRTVDEKELLAMAGRLAA